MNEEDSKPKEGIFDKVSNLVNKENQSNKPVDPSTLKNVRTQSMVVSEREQAEQELQQMEILRSQQQREAMVEATVDTAKKTGVYIVITVICLILLLLVGILIFTLIPYLRRPSRNNPDISGGQSQTVTIGYYECLTSDCKELTELPDGRKLAYDGNYVILDEENEETFTTAITGYYESATAFEWGDKLYVHVVLGTKVGAIFSITDNKYITDNNYTEIFADIEDNVYADQTWLEGQYIIAKRSGDYRLVDIANGKEKVQGAKAVFATKNNFFVGYDEDGGRRVFNDSNIQLAYVEEGDIFTRDNYVIVVNGNSYDVYNKDGEVEEFSFKQEFESVASGNLSNSLSGNSAYSKVPN